MAFVGLVSGVSGDLNVAQYDYGYFNDIVLAVEDTGAAVATYEGDDLIDYSRLISSSNIWTVYCGSGNDTVIGGGGTQSVHDGSGNDNISLGAGNDFAHDGAGDDVFDGGGGVDVLSLQYESYDGFGPLVYNTAGVTVDLAIKTAQDLGVFGMDVILNFEGVNGGFGNDRLLGNGKDNVLSAYSGNDVLIGRNGDDTLLGDSGRDIMVGGKGADKLYDYTISDSARDVFRYLDIRDSNATDGIDEIFNFDDGGATTDDRIDLRAIDANAAAVGNQKFHFIGTAAFDTSANGQVRYETDGTDTFVYIDTNTDTNAEMTIIVRGLTSLAAGDFIL